MTYFSAFHVRKRNRNPCGYAFEKNFFAKTLHPYTNTLSNIHNVSSLLRISNIRKPYTNPTPTLH